MQYICRKFSILNYMWRYGRKIIGNIFKKRRECVGLCAELECRSEADCDRRDIGVFEIGLSSEQYGDYEQGTGNSAYENESARLIDIAKNNGRFITKSQIESFGDRKRLPSGESVVYFDGKNSCVYKVRNPFAKSHLKRLHAQDVIYEHLVHNILFPNTRYSLVGIGEENGEVRLVFRQPYISDKYPVPSMDRIESYLQNGLGLKKENKYYYGNEWLAVTDVSNEGDNVLADDECLYFIDPIIMLKHPAKEVLNHYYSLLS